MSTQPDPAQPLRRTALYDLHVQLGAKIVPFAGYEMPVQYPDGIISEHKHTRAAAGLFDVSHMGQAMLSGPDHATTAAALEKLVPGDIAGLAPGNIRYTQFTNDAGGIRDDLMVTRPAGDNSDGKLFVVVNAACKQADFDWLNQHLPANISLEVYDHLALVALQGPKAAGVLSAHCPGADGMDFMSAMDTAFDGIACQISRSGYTGEDGYEISVAADQVNRLARTLLDNGDVRPVGLGARDSLRLEAGLCLYGHDIDETTSPVEAGLLWSISKRRRTEGGFFGDTRIMREIAEGPARRRVGIQPEGRAPAREGTGIMAQDGSPAGTITSGGFGPSTGGPVAMGYVTAGLAKPGTPLSLVVRGKQLPAHTVRMPFVPHGYKR